MAPTLHSTFSASSSSRLLACPGSYAAALAADTGRKSTIFSAEGTLAHAISEANLIAGTEPDAMVGRRMQADGFEFEVDQDMADAVNVYVGFLRGLRALGYLVALENRVSPQWQWPLRGLEHLQVDLFGTADCIAFDPQTGQLVVADLKFGKGVAVEVEANPQLLYYAAGALNPAILDQLCAQHGMSSARPVGVDLVIVQPRAFHPEGPVRSTSYTVAEVEDWNAFVLHPGVKRALEDGGTTFAAGKHCRFCPVSQTCPELRDFGLETARAAFRQAPAENIPVADTAPETIPSVLPAFDLSDAALGDLLDRITILGPWIEGLKTLAADRIEAGRDVKGWKLAPKAARRSWSGDEEEITQNLHAQGLATDQFTRRVLMSPAQVEKEVGKKFYAAHVQQFVGKSSSGTTLAPDGDPRTRLKGRTAREAFIQPLATETKE